MPASATSYDSFRRIDKKTIRVRLLVLLTPIMVWLISKIAFSREMPSRISILMLGITLILLIVFDKSSDVKLRKTARHKPILSYLDPYYCQTVMMLIFPPISWFMADILFPVGREVAFLSIFMVRLRSLVAAILGVPMLHADGTKVLINRSVTGSVTCHVDVDIRRMLRFIKSERSKASSNQHTVDSSSAYTILTEKKKNHTQVSAIHVVARAVAIAISEMPQLNGRKVRMPFLGQNGWYSNRTIDISLISQSLSKVPSDINNSSNTTSIAAQTFVKLTNSEQLSVQAIANTTASNVQHEINFDKNHESSIKNKFRTLFHNLAETLDMPITFARQNGRRFGSCVILTAPGASLKKSTTNETVVDILPLSVLGAETTVFVTIGGVRVLWNEAEQIKQHMISINLTLDCPACTPLNCQHFAERVRSLIQSTDEL